MRRGIRNMEKYRLDRAGRHGHRYRHQSLISRIFAAIAGRRRADGDCMPAAQYVDGAPGTVAMCCCSIGVHHPSIDTWVRRQAWL